MPTLTRLYVKSGLVCLILAVMTALSLKIAAPEPGYLSRLAPLYYHLFMVGWVTQLIFGISFWMFPRHTREKPRGIEPLAWITFIFLNAGLLLRVISEPIIISDPSWFWRWTIIVSGILQWLAGIGYVIHIWNRVK